MGFGNYKTEGSKGLNTPWQYAIIELLKWIRQGLVLPDSQDDLKGIIDITDTDPVTLFPAVPGGINVITDLLVSNGSATDGSWVEIRDTDENGTLLWRGYAGSVGGGFIQPAMKKPIYQRKENTPMVVVCGTAAEICVSANGYKLL